MVLLNTVEYRILLHHEFLDQITLLKALGKQNKTLNFFEQPKKVFPNFYVKYHPSHSFKEIA